MIGTAKNGQFCGRMLTFDKRKDVSVGFINGHPAAHETLANLDFVTPSLTSVFTSSNANPIEKSENRSISSHRNVGKSIALEYLFNLQAGIAKKGTHVSFENVIGRSDARKA